LDLAEKDRRKISAVADLLRRGGVLLKEACPRCGGVMVKYKDMTLCVNCDSLVDLEAVRITSPKDVGQKLKALISVKIEEAANQLSEETDVERQVQIATLLLKYMEILERVMPEPEKTEEDKKHKTG